MLVLLPGKDPWVLQLCEPEVATHRIWSLQTPWSWFSSTDLCKKQISPWCLIIASRIYQEVIACLQVAVRITWKNLGASVYCSSSLCSLFPLLREEGFLQMRQMISNAVGTWSSPNLKYNSQTKATGITMSFIEIGFHIWNTNFTSIWKGLGKWVIARFPDSS